MDLFTLVTDALEESEPDDRIWLDAAIAATAGADERGRSEMRDVLTTVAAEYRLHRRETSAIRALAKDLPELTSAGDLRFGPDELDQLADVVRSLLCLQRAYVDAVEALLGTAS
ncbi:MULTISPECIES: hypothetical protein [unclassified Nocardioides]|uniref:hypothetical protein n=1 Tax=unclassified Nocardioides TaxID=2615069 RepID=UPI000702D41F|nr:MULTISPECIES: hypothetical protein [unclassified Nocardioides]KRC54179.1 hypothetical protein ASE19_09015 [Nocardioides sp. Root79]KRC71515.1 hypothetical protein ASE20_11430 [Nocardioides sp. Root240]